MKIDTTGNGIIITGIEDDGVKGAELHLMQQPDGDVIISIIDKKTGKKLSAEVCSGSGGGKNPPIVNRVLQVAISQIIEWHKKEIM